MDVFGYQATFHIVIQGPSLLLSCAFIIFLASEPAPLHHVQYTGVERVCERLDTGGVHRQELEDTHHFLPYVIIQNTVTWPRQTAREAEKGSVAMCQEVKEKDICQSKAVCIKYPIHNNRSMLITCDPRTNHSSSLGLHLLSVYVRSPVLILRS